MDGIFPSDERNKILLSGRITRVRLIEMDSPVVWETIDLLDNAFDNTWEACKFFVFRSKRNTKYVRDERHWHLTCVYVRDGISVCDIEIEV